MEWENLGISNGIRRGRGLAVEQVRKRVGGVLFRNDLGRGTVLFGRLRGCRARIFCRKKSVLLLLRDFGEIGSGLLGGEIMGQGWLKWR